MKLNLKFNIRLATLYAMVSVLVNFFLYDNFVAAILVTGPVAFIILLCYFTLVDYFLDEDIDEPI
jgi:hypothetical protein